MKHMIRTIAALVTLAVPCLAGSGLVLQEERATARTESWPASIVELAESLPVQDGGRIKPLHTFASFTLLRLNGKRSVKLADGERLSAVEWLLDTLFFPQASADYPVFLIQDSEAARAIGISVDDKKKRDRYSFNELRTGIPRLFELAHEYGAIEKKNRSTIQEQVHILAGNVNSFMVLQDHMAFAREPIRVGSNPDLAAVFGGRSEVPFRDVVLAIPELGALYGRFNRESGTPEAQSGMQAIDRLLDVTSRLAGSTYMLVFIPPTTAQAEEWITPEEMLEHAARIGPPATEHLEVIAGLEGMARDPADYANFEREFSTVHANIVQLAKARGEYRKVGLELRYYKIKLLTYSLYAFVLGFLIMAFMWLVPNRGGLYRAASAVVLVAALLLSAAIVMRCMIRGRPPVSTLYETVLFVTAVGTLVALIAERINHQRVALSAAAILGVVGLFLANGYEMLDKQDTMPSLVAVLDTNFWLATHVTAITIGYSAGMLAALLASIYILAKALRLKRDDRGFYKGLGRMVYGVLCFAMIFSVIGTILGGVWANDSWGRFWGWDPKENGALLIVLSQIAILHGRMGGYLREHGVCMAVALGGTIVAFSWWGVNLLGVGLHSYGFTSGISKALWTYYGIQWGIVGIGAIVWLVERSANRRAAETRTLTRAEPEPEGLAPEMASVSNPPA